MSVSRMQFVRAAAALLGSVAFGMCSGNALAQMGGMGGMGGMGKGGGHGGGEHEGMGGMGMGGGHGMHNMPGQVEPMCRGEDGDMPPHYCEPSYKVMSSIAGVQIDHVTLNNEKSVSVMLKSTLGATPRLVIVGGTGALAGGTVVGAGWKDGTHVKMDFAGTDSLYAHRSVHLHVFPITEK